MVAKTFGPTQGKMAQDWVEKAVKGGGASPASLMEMQLTLFEECQLEDDSAEGGRCKELSEAIDDLTSAVEKRKEEKAEGKPFTITFGATPIQEAATKLRETASLFGPEQKQAADAWIKKVTSGQAASADAMLQEQITLFGECVLSDEGTPSNCQQLEAVLAELQAAIDVCEITPTYSSDSCNPEGVAGELKEDLKAVAEIAPDVEETEPESAPVTGRKRKAIKKFLGKFLFWRRTPVLSALDVANFLAAPQEADPALEGASVDEAVAALKAEGISDEIITRRR